MQKLNEKYCQIRQCKLKKKDTIGLNTDSMAIISDPNDINRTVILGYHEEWVYDGTTIILKMKRIISKTKIIK
jgi:hypothetical protein